MEQSAFTSWGPTDDWRIKPDITAVGVSSYSTEYINDSYYGSGNGCSYASPIVSGGLALLQQHYYNSNAVYMKAVTAKALILSTTDEAGEYDGPDFSNGWGLFNAFKAAEVITNNGVSSIISELKLKQDETYSLKINVDGTQPLSVAICWNDPAAEPLTSGIYNDATPLLINDLDVRVETDSELYYPWMMEPNNNFNNYTVAASKGDNFRDNIEIINVKNLNAGEYTVNVSHKGVLKDGLQEFSLIINGVVYESLSSSKFDNEEVGVIVFPNPVKDVLKIKFDSNKFQEIRVNVYNMLGQKEIETKYSNQSDFELDFSDLSRGVYILKIQDDKDNIVTTKNIVLN